MNKHLLLILILPFLLFSCSTHKITPPITPLDSDTSLTAIDTTLIFDGCYNSAFIYDELLVLIANCDQHFFHVYDKETLVLKRKFGIKGRGPYEFGFPFPFGTNTTNNKKDSIFEFYDLHIPKVTSVNFNSIIRSEKLSESLTLKTQDVNLFECDMINKLHNNKVAGTSNDKQSANGLFFIYDIETRKKEWIEYQPKMKFESRYVTSAYTSYIYSNSETIVYASLYFDEVLFFNSNGELLEEHYFSELQKPILSKQYSGVDRESIIYTRGIYGTSKFCYVLRLAQAGTELDKLYKSQLESGNLPCQILVFDWEGNLVNVFQIDSLPNSFAVDEATNTLYCILFNDKPDDYIRIVRFSME